MNKSPRSVEDLLLDNEALLERTEVLEKRNGILSFEVQNLQEIVSQMEDDYHELQKELAHYKAKSVNLAQSYRDLSKENHELKSEIADMRFTRKYLTSEEAGKAFARELLGKPMTPEEVAIDEAENTYVPYNGDDF